MTARHSSYRRSLELGLFDGINSFADVEARISALESNKERGDAFEVFAEAYFATQKINEAREVWPFESIPLEQRKLLALDTGTDMGVDGTYITHTGELRAYQVKFRSRRPALTWDELSTFMGLTDQVSQRVLFTNCESLPKLMNDRSGFIAIRGSDLDRLTQEDFEAMREWLINGIIKVPRKLPQPHQKEALSAISSAIEEGDRATIIMACGTGKSLVALWAAEQRDCRNILVLLPSLALVRQLLHEWLRQTSWESLTFQCVCSDSTVAKDADDLIVHQADLDFPVTTESSAVYHFLTKPFDGVKVVFSTYQSAHVVAGGIPVNTDGIKIPFDLGVFDEAHKTAGREGRNYSFALEDVNLPIRKRMFFTATPRHYNPHKRDKEGEAQLVYSMDNPEAYGKQAYVLTFGEAANRGIICNYKVLISVITSDMVTDELLSKGEVLINGDTVRARQVANQIALRDAVERYGVKKIFTFHKTVKSAASFVSDRNEGICTHLKEFKSYHVNGEMPTARRDKVMHEFRGADKAVMSNARCLTEGVDVPAVDMVAFLSPRRSRVDIVQATGRAMRRADGKNIGYVLVPLYVEVAAGETVDTAVSRAEFEEVWDVLQSLQEQDEVLAEFIRYVGEQKGRGKGFDDKGYADRIDFIGACLSFEQLSAAVATRCVENLYSSWDSWLGKLQSYKEKFGHCNVVIGENEYRDLAFWVSSQRVRKSKGTLSEARIERLNSIGIVWDFQQQKTDETWLKWYSELEKYTYENGNPNVNRRDKNTKLASWVWIQRLRRERNYNAAKKLTERQVELLDKLGFSWNAQDRWVKQLEKLKKFKSKFGHCDVELEKDNHSPLLRWLNTQRADRRRGELQSEREVMLNELGVAWDGGALLDAKWREMYDRLKQYHAENGNSNVPYLYEGSRQLAAWVSHQRQSKRGNILNEEQINLLDKLNFSWKMRERGSWEDRLAEVIAFKEKHGHCDIPLSITDPPKLGGFVNATRVQRNKGTLSAERIAKLDSVGFVWEGNITKIQDDGMNDVWKGRFDELLQYKKLHGSFQVPVNKSEHTQLRYWIQQQRYQKKKGNLHHERVKLLEEHGFAWEGTRKISPWQFRYNELIKYMEEHGNLDVPYNYQENIALGSWVLNQRRNKRLSKLSAEQEGLLNDIGFVWSKRGEK